MLEMFLITFVVFVVAMAAMAVGVIVSNRRIQGSCGGLANMSDEFGDPMCDCGKKPGECGVELPPLEAPKS